MKKSIVISLVLLTISVQSSKGQSQIYPEHFDLSEVRLLDSPFKTSLATNAKLLMSYDVDRLLCPFIREAGLSNKTGKYKGWTSTHPSFSNWGLDSWSLEGHVGGHYLTALAMTYAATDDATMKSRIKTRLEYMLEVLKDCQDAYDGSTDGMEGFIGGQPITQIWRGLYKNDTSEFNRYGGWVPFYCEHKVLAGLRDAWLYTGSELARDLFKKLCDWSVNVVSNLSTETMQGILGWEHGGMNEPLADAYRLFGDTKYLTAARKYSHQQMIDGMQSLNRTVLDGKHANTQVPKYIGFERIYQEYKRDGKSSVANYRTAAHNFWNDVSKNRTVCIGGNSVSEHFLASSRGSQYIDNLDGPESCNSNNMLKLSEILFDENHDARYADFYESTMWNHILSTQDPKTGGYVYFTTLRPQGYRIYSRVNQGMWCCVGTGMENHAKYGHFIYTHSDDNSQLFVNLFTASELRSEHFSLTQSTSFPYSDKSVITIDAAGDFTLSIRHPSWACEGFDISVNGVSVNAATTVGKASYVDIKRSWNKGDVVEITLPMELRYEECPNYGDYIAFKYGPILLAGKTTSTSQAEANKTGLKFESLQNEYGGEGRMDHAPGVMASSKSLSSAPLLIGNREEVLNRITITDDSPSTLQFKIEASNYGTGGWKELTLMPFYAIHHCRYVCYWYQQTEENYLQSNMGKSDAEAAEIESRTLDFVATGEQQSEAGHDALYEKSSNGNYNTETYRDCSRGGYIQYTLFNSELKTDSLSILCRFTTADKGRTCNIFIDEEKLVDGYKVPETHANANENGFYNVEFPIPSEMMYDNEGKIKEKIVFKMSPATTSMAPGLYYLRLMMGYDEHIYTFHASDWKTGDPGRVSQDNISYNNAKNTITVKASGQNNVCLSLDYENLQYNVRETDKYLIVKGKGLNVSSGKSYLWWLNGSNHGTSVPPTYTGVASDKEQVVCWDITASGINENCKGELYSVCQGMTIFGLTSSSGTATISDISFASDIDEYLASVGIEETILENASDGLWYDLGGVAHNDPVKGVNIQKGKKVVF